MTEPLEIAEQDEALAHGLWHWHIRNSCLSAWRVWRSFDRAVQLALANRHCVLFPGSLERVASPAYGAGACTNPVASAEDHDFERDRISAPRGSVARRGRRRNGVAQCGGSTAVITDPENVERALAGETGTTIVR